MAYRDRDSGSRAGEEGRKVYVGEIGDRIEKEELQGMFERYGKLNSVWVARNPPGFAFVEFEDKRDAEDAVKELDGQKLSGRILKVEHARGGRRRGGGGRGGYRGGGGGGRYGGGGYNDRGRDGGYRDRGYGGGGRSYGGGDRYRDRSPRRHSRSRSGSPN